jgi:predicted metal-dependent HD superfamily phosphohydrolase
MLLGNDERTQSFWTLMQQRAMPDAGAHTMLHISASLSDLSHHLLSVLHLTVANDGGSGDLSL